MTRAAVVAKSMFGDAPYQRRAREALPILVRQAEAGKELTYKQLAAEMGMPNARNLNFVLGSVAVTLQALGRKWRERVPPIEVLVINSGTKLPGTGVDAFLSVPRRARLSASQRRIIIQAHWLDIFAYTKWDEVLAECGLQRVADDLGGLVDKASRRGGTGESREHRDLKEHVRLNPLLVGLPARHPHGVTERRLPSSDCVDVAFEAKGRCTAVEVKSWRSDKADIVRGLFQCVKYKALFEAEFAHKQSKTALSVYLVLGGAFPRRLNRLRNVLGIDVIDRVMPGPAKPARRRASGCGKSPGD